MQRWLRLALPLVILVLAAPAAALVTPKLLADRPAFEVAGDRAARATPDFGERVPPQRQHAWKVFVDQYGGAWTASWDRATGVPSRIHGSGIQVDGAIADADTARRHAGEMLERHIALLAPGASAGDFEMVSNVVHRGLRSVGFVQRHQGLPVVGGQVSFRYKNDRLFVIGSEALPFVEASARADRVSDAEARRRAEAWILSDSAAKADALAVDGPMILPIVGATQVVAYHRVVAVTVDASAPLGSWRVYLDAATGEPVAREQTLRFTSGSVFYNVPVRQPRGERADYPARGATVTVLGQPLTVDDDGVLTWPGEGAATVNAAVVGPLVAVTNVAGAAATASLGLLPDDSVTWDRRGDEHVDAQLTSFIHARLVKDYARNLNPELAWLDTPQEVNVNIDDQCNAFSNGDSINFYQASDDCENTARLADVVYHEFGHSLHAHSIIEGVGAFEGALSEGLSDYLAATITNDPAMGRGFFKNDDPLRHVDPPEAEHVWPRDVAGVHYTGLIISGALWDLRKLLVDHYGPEVGVPLADRLFYAAMQRSTNIPTTYVEVLAEDDDDGDLSNGTPNLCDINAAFAAHGLRSVAAEIDVLGVEAPSAAGHPVALRVTGLVPQCPGDSVAGATLMWSLDGADDTSGDVPMTETGDDAFEASIPDLPAGSTVRYRVVVEFADGTTRSYPDNAADPLYQFYIGEVVPLYCTDFESDPFADGWTHGLSRGEAGDGADDWMWGPPMGLPASGDPSAARSGESVIGNDLGGANMNGTYQPNKTNWAMSPVVDVGQYSDVRLQYWRWLNVEDAFFDDGTIYANEQLVWQNLDSDNGNGSTLHHQDREWRFHDVPLSQVGGDSVQVKFEISSDAGLELGGWTLDDFCIVANAASVCGDGEISGVEECDDGDENSDTEASACRTSCRVAICGDGVVDDGEACDDGNGVDGDDCPTSCLDEGGDGDDGGGCGCQTGEGVPLGTAMLWLAVGAVLVLRKRRPIR